MAKIKHGDPGEMCPRRIVGEGDVLRRNTYVPMFLSERKNSNF
jgi:hypothetical protein